MSPVDFLILTAKNSLILRKTIFVILCLALIAEIIRDIFVEGDFKGYVIAGNLVLNGQDIYSNYLNTWPPFFSVFCVPLSLIDAISPKGLRLLWLVGSIVSFAFIINITAEWFLKKKVRFYVFSGQDGNKIAFTDTVILIPVLILFRYVLENLSNIQINIYLLLLCLLSIHYFIKGNNLLTGLFLAFAISLKVYPIFLLLFLVFKREFRASAWTVLFIITSGTITLLVWGREQAFVYYADWHHKFVIPYADALRTNQSVFAFFRRVLTDSNTGFPLKVNILNIAVDDLKPLSYLVILIAAAFPAWLFRKRFSEKSSLDALLQFSFVLTAIPLLSPLAWKAYFIFLWAGYFSSYYLLFHYKTFLSQQLSTTLKTLFFISIALTVFSTELIVGPWFSDVLEVFSCVMLGTVLLLVVQLILYTQLRMHTQKVF